MDVSFHRPFLTGTSLEPAVIPTAQTSSFTLQHNYYTDTIKNTCKAGEEADYDDSTEVLKVNLLYLLSP